MLNIIIPIYILSFMSCCSFLIPVGGGERLGFVMTIQLGVIFTMTMIESKVAPSGEFAKPLIFGFIYYVDVLCAVSLIIALCFRNEGWWLRIRFMLPTPKTTVALSDTDEKIVGSNVVASKVDTAQVTLQN